MNALHHSAPDRIDGFAVMRGVRKGTAERLSRGSNERPTLDAAERAQQFSNESVFRRAPADRIVGRAGVLL